MDSRSWERLFQSLDFELPPELIARYPSARRGDSRLLVVEKDTGRLSDRTFADLPELLVPGDLLIFNRTRVSRRRVRLRRATGARIEALFLEELPDGRWHVLLRGAGRIRTGEVLGLEGADTTTSFQFCGRAGQTGPGLLLKPVDPGGDAVLLTEEFFERFGELPIPPYLGRPAEAVDTERYQTVMATGGSSVAAPTAGLHFTGGLLDALQNRGVARAELELLVGYGTFAPLTDENVRTGRLHRETYTITEDCALAYAVTTGRRVAVGTTTLRALESEWRARTGPSGRPPQSAGPEHDRPEGPRRIRAGTHITDLFVHPPDVVRSIDGLITNFHLPRSALLLFTAAFAGTELVREAYAHAIRERYRFYSYGDAMLIIGRASESS